VAQTNCTEARCASFCRECAFDILLATAIVSSTVGLIVYHLIVKSRLRAMGTLWHNRWDNMQSAGGIALVATYLLFVPITTAILGLLLRPMSVNRLLDQARRLLRPARLLVLGGLLLAAYIFLFNRAGPRIYDDTTYIFQARLFASGQAALQTCELPQYESSFYWHWTVTRGGRLFSFQMPGHSLLLVPALWAGSLGLMPLLLYLLAGVAVYRAGRNLFGPFAAKLALFMFALSPWCLAVYSGFSVSTSAAAVAACSLWAWSRYRRRPSWPDALALGGLLGLLLWIRPTTLAFVGLPLAAWTAARLFTRPREIPMAAAAVVPVVFMAALMAVYCWRLNGACSWTPGNVYSERMSSEEFGSANLLNPTTLTLLGRTLLYLSLIAFPIPLGSLAGLWLTRRGCSRGRQDAFWVLAAMPVLMILFYALKSRVLSWYFFEVFPAACLLMAVVLERTLAAARLRASAPPLPGRQQSRRACAFAAAALAMVFIAVPLTLMREHDYTQSYNILDDEVARRLPAFGKALVVLDEALPLSRARELLSRNDPKLRGSRIYVGAHALDDPVSATDLIRRCRPDAVYRLHTESLSQPHITLEPLPSDILGPLAGRADNVRY
jgi:hypothetical protein